MNVLFVTQYGYLAASSRTRVFQYLPLLRDQGIAADILTVLPDLGIDGSQLLGTANRWRKLLYYVWATWRTVRCGLAAWWRLSRYDLLFIQKIIFRRRFAGFWHQDDHVPSTILTTLSSLPR